MKGNCAADQNICMVVNQDVVHKRLVRPQGYCTKEGSSLHRSVEEGAMLSRAKGCGSGLAETRQCRVVRRNRLRGATS